MVYSARPKLHHVTPCLIRVVLKPDRGAASMDVYCAPDLASAQRAFAAIHRTGSHGGGLNEAVLVQE